MFNTLWAAAKANQYEVQAQQLQQLLATFTNMLGEPDPQAISNTLWAMAKAQQQVQTDQLLHMLVAHTSNNNEAKLWTLRTPFSRQWPSVGSGAAAAGVSQAAAAASCVHQHGQRQSHRYSH